MLNLTATRPDDRGAAPPPRAPALAWCLARFADHEVEAIERHVLGRLAALPTPLADDPRLPLSRQRHAYARVAAYAADRLGRPGALIEHLRVAWLRGASVLPFLHALTGDGRGDEASFVARIALISAEGDEEEGIEDFLSEGGEPPPGWQEAVRAFARAPSLGAWRQLHRFTPADRQELRVRATLRYLRRLGVSPDVVFELATEDGLRFDAVELVDCGLVSVGVVLRGLRAAPPGERALWLGLAARAAFAEGDRFGTVRFLGEAYRVGHPPLLPIMQAIDIREQADDELHRMLDRVGVPRF